MGWKVPNPLRRVQIGLCLGPVIGVPERYLRESWAMSLSASVHET